MARQFLKAAGGKKCYFSLVKGKQPEQNIQCLTKFSVRD